MQAEFRDGDKGGSDGTEIECIERKVVDKREHGQQVADGTLGKQYCCAFIKKNGNQSIVNNRAYFEVR